MIDYLVVVKRTDCHNNTTGYTNLILWKFQPNFMIEEQIPFHAVVVSFVVNIYFLPNKLSGS